MNPSVLPKKIFPNSGPDHELVGTCYSVYSNEDQPRDEYLYRAGCAFRRNVSFIFKVGGDYVQIRTAEELKIFFGSIDSPKEALVYALLMTGLRAQYALDYHHDLLYFQDTILGTQVIETDEGYSLNLFHFQGCLCEPWVNSEVSLLVGRSGELTWVGAVPVSMTTGFSCTD